MAATGVKMGKRGAWALLLMAVGGCDDEATRGDCYIERIDGGVTVHCQDAGEVEIPVAPAAGRGATGAVGATGADGRDGPPGEKGAPGEQGPRGESASCHVSERDGGTAIECSDGSEVIIPDAEPAGMPEGPPLTWVSGAGLSVEVVAAGIDADRHPYAELRITDGDGVPLDREGLFTQGAVSARFTVATLEGDPGGEHYRAYLLAPQTSPITDETYDLPSAEANGTWRTLDANEGVYAYRYANALPEGYDASASHTVALWASRRVGDVAYATDAWAHFVPATGAAAQAPDIAPTTSCSGCHNPLSAHGGQRLSTQLCVTCHTSQAVDPDTGNSVDFKIMVHKIHMGEHLPSVVAATPYRIVGFQQSEHDFSDVVFPHEVNRCETCHTGSDGDRWATNPTREVCGSCHDNVDFDLPFPDADPSDDIIPHAGGPKSNGTCTNCHAPTGLPGASVEDVHLRARLNPNTPRLAVEILDVVNTAPADTPVVSFRVTVDGVGRDLLTSPISRMSIVLAGPSSDIQGNRSYTVAQGSLTAIDAAAGEFAYTFTQTIAEAAAAATPAIAAEGSFAVMIEARNTFTVPLAGGGTESVTVGAVNPVRYVAVTDPDPVARRAVVSDDKCNSCHGQIAFHGSNRLSVNACVLCHTGNLDTLGRMPTPPSGQTADTVTVRFGPMIHRIHGAAIAGGPYTVYANGGGALDFSALRFPGAAQDCETCHLPQTYTLPLADGLIATTTRIKNDSGTSAGVLDVVSPTASNCRGCHDSEAAAVHTGLMTDDAGRESCAVCHGVGKTSDVEAVHARPQWDY